MIGKINYARLLIFAGVYTLLLGGSLWAVERALRHEVQIITEAANSSFTRVLVNNQWGTLRPKLGLDRDAEAAKSNPEMLAIDKSIRAFAQGTDLVKVKIYNLKGLTLYSSDPAQIGEDKSSNAGFKLASKGRVASELNYRGKFGAFDGEVYNRNLVSSYVPVRGAQGVEAVVEVYTDRTESIEQVDRRVYQLAATLASLLGLAFAFIYWLTGRRILSSQGTPAAMEGQPPSKKHSMEGAEPLSEEVVSQLARSIQKCSGALHDVTQQLMATPLDATQAKLVQALVAMGREADVQVHHLDLWRRCVHGDRAAVAIPIDLHDLLCRMAEQQARVARDQGLGCQVYVASDIPARYNGDPEMLRVVLELAMRDVIDRATTGVVQFKAQTGVQSVQVDIISAVSDGSRGDGLGLLVAQRLMAAMGGVLQVQGSGKGGEWLSLVLPIEKERA